MDYIYPSDIEYKTSSSSSGTNSDSSLSGCETETEKEGDEESDWSDIHQGGILDVPLDIVTRDSWKAEPPKGEIPLLEHPVHHALFIWAHVDECKNKRECIRLMQELQRRDMGDLGFPDIAHNFYIAPDLTVFEGRGYDTSASVTYKLFATFETQKFDICYLGRYDGDDYPSEEVMQVRDEILRFGQSQGYITEHYYNSLPTIVPMTTSDEESS